MARLKQRKQAREINVNPEISILALVSFPGTSRRLGSHVARRLFDGSFWLDQTVLSVNNTMPRAGRPSSRAAFEATKFLLHFSSYNLMAGGRVEHGRRPLLKPVRVGLREQGCVAGAVCFTCNKGNAIKIARTWADMPPTFLRARTEALQTARPLCAVGPTFSDFTILDTEGMCC